MANTKFLDYNGLSKLVEKIKNTYVNIGGSTMTGTLKTLENQPAINFRPNNSAYSVTLNYDTESAEALAINLKNPATSFMINSGVDGTTWTGEGHQSKVTPTIQVRKNCVSINKYIADNITTEYKLDVNGDVKANSFTGKLNGNANTASKLGTATVGGATKPMYLNGGTPAACSHSINADVPSNAKFTDTTYNIYQYPRTLNSFWVTENDNYDTAQEIVINDVEHALKADSLNVNDTPIGDDTTPVYINSSGKPTAISYSINANVPSGAKFTDTTYTDLKGATASANGTHGLVPAPTSKDVGKFLKGDGTWSTPTTYVNELSQDAVENILGGSTMRYNGFLSGDGLKIVVDTLKTLMGTVEIPFASLEVMYFSGSAERVAIKMSNEFAQTQFFDNLYNMKFIKFDDGCVFTRIGLTLNYGFPIFKGAVVDQVQGIDNMVAWISADDSNTYLIFDDVNNTSVSGFLDDTYTPTPLQVKLTWDH